MRNTAFFIAGVVLVLIQSNLFRLIGLLLHFIGWVVRAKQDLSVAGLVPSLVLPLILFMGVHEYSLVRGACVAFALGYLTDLVGWAPIGLYTFTHVAIYVLARAAGVRLAAQTMLMQVGLAFAFTLVHSVMILVLVAIFGKDPYVPRTLYPLILPHVLITGACAPLVFRLANRIHAATITGAPKEAMRSRG
jgi:rod shape-determining protein MreD